MRKLSPQRRKVVVLFAAVACLAGASVLLQGHPGVLAGCIAVQVILLVVGVVQLAKLKRQG
jgi:hypothetical protein